ncbi:MAG TPA: SpoIIE family protein phosphatase [Anaerolineales bacterium]|nr:SpoIIE family protein phosphatase [Anaerolineales bacterium]
MSKSQTASLGDILVVDDMPSNLRLLSQTLAEKGYGVRTVTSGARALESARTSPPDLILLDVRMPDMDGYEVCTYLKEDQRTAHIPIIFISALDQVEDKVQAFQFGGVDYITKPFQVEEVLARTETHLALRRLQEHLEKINRRMQLELTLAGAVQSSFLPSQMPEVAGWQLVASLQSARETSGDFYDVIQLPDGRFGLLIADVVDKGVPAALLMALSWSLMWNYAIQYPDSPQTVFAEVNRRLLLHLGGSQFFTCFYGVLNPEDGTLTYTNAGHPPPLQLKKGKGKIDSLERTGPPLGVLEEGQWDPVDVVIKSGESLILYTDGVTDAVNASGNFYGSQRLLAFVERTKGKSAQALHDALLADIDNFGAGELQYDDTALIVTQRQ